MALRLGRLAVWVMTAAALLSGCSGGTTGTGGTTSTGSTTSTSTVSAGGLWAPVPGQPWQWQLTTPVDTSVNVPVFDIDGFDNSSSVVAALHAKGAKAICYIDVGTAENFRSDYSKFPASVLGASNGWPGERWLDIRQISLLSPIMTARMDMCKAKGFDAVEPDNVDGYTNSTGFPLTAADQIAYNTWIAGLAHARGMSVALKNDLDQIPQLLPVFDFAIDEQCAQYNECSTLTPFIKAGKAVLHVEYNLPTSQFCPVTVPLGFSSMLKNLALDAPRWPC